MSLIWVAEAGSLHKQNASLACEMARQAGEAGATIFKVQFGHDRADPVRSVSRELAFILRDYCRYLGIELMASIFSLEGFMLARELELPRYKLAYQIRARAEIRESVLAEGKETFVTGITGVAPPARAIFAVSKYPTYPADLEMPICFDEWYGYSDHSHGIEACLLAVARGAKYIEAHFTLDKTDLWTKDSAFAKSPAEFAEMVRLGNGLHQLVNSLENRPHGP